MAEMTDEDRYDLAIIGSGGAAFAAAIATRRKQRRVVMVERSTIGGTCVNTGCVPSKALLAAARASLKYVDLAAAYGFQVVAGHARFLPDPTGGVALQVNLKSGGGRRIRAAHYLIATGSTPWAPPSQAWTTSATSPRPPRWRCQSCPARCW